MARADYDLQSIREGTVISSNGTTYTINLLWTPTSGSGTLMQFDSSGVKISYETPNEQDKNSYILASKCDIPFLVQDATDKAFINSLSTSYNERDVWITVREGSNMLWCGYVVLDLKDEQDVSYPYEVNLTAVDGLASLKDIPYVRETNINTGVVPEFPYIMGDTYYNADYFNLLQNTVGGTATKYIADLLSKTGQLLADDDTGGTTFLENYTIQTSINYYNEGHPAPATAIDPLAYTRIKIRKLHKRLEGNYITPPDAYSVLEYICKNFGMRCVYWQHSFHFIQINEYNTNEDAAGTATAPINIPTRLYFYNGLPATTSSQNYVGNNNLSIYNLELENDTTVTGLQKLAGTIYSGLPAIKKVDAVALSTETENVYTGFPVFPTFSAGANDYVRYPYDGSGAEVWSVMTDVADADGIKLKFDLSFKNTTNTTIGMKTMFLLVAKDASQTATFPMKVCKRKFEATPDIYEWDDWTSGSLPFTGSSAGRRWTKSDVFINPTAAINNSNGVLSYDSATDPFCASTAGLFPVDPAFTGDWQFSIITWTHWQGTSATSPMKNLFATYGTNVSHGQCYTYVGSNPLNFDGSALVIYQPITDYKYDYENTLNPISGTNVPYSGIMKSVSTEGNLTLQYVVEVETNNSYILDAGNYFWGEGSTIEVSSDGTNYVPAGVDKWTKPTYAWNSGTSQFDYTVGSYDKPLVQLNIYDMIYNQSIALKQFNGTTALSETNKYYSGTTILKYFNPIGRLKDTDGNKYLFMRGSFNLSMDEWNITSDEMSYNVPSETINLGTRSTSVEITIEDED